MLSAGVLFGLRMLVIANYFTIDKPSSGSVAAFGKVVFLVKESK
jgi:hypothetical protein